MGNYAAGINGKGLSTMRHCGAFRAVPWILVLALTPSLAAAQQFGGDLDPAPHDNSTRDNVVGTGQVFANLSGNTLQVSGHFAGLSSPVTSAHLEMGVAMGVPGSAIGELSTTGSLNGEISGRVVLNAQEIAALGKGALYVQLDSAKAPDGNSWAWLQSGDGH
jgi:hypothetical protein